MSWYQKALSGNIICLLACKQKCVLGLSPELTTQYYSDSRQCFAEIYLSSSCDLVSYKVVIVMATNNPNNPLMTFTEYEKASDPKGTKIPLKLWLTKNVSQVRKKKK